MADFLPIALQINWQPVMPAWLLLPLALAAAATLLLLWRHARDTCGKRVAATIAAIRGMILLLLLLTLTQPLLRRQAVTDQQRNVIALIDTSASMTLSCADGATRLEHAIRALEKIGAALPAAWSWQIHPFVNTMQPAAAQAAALRGDTNGVPTDIAAPLSQADREAAAANAATILIISDGGDTPNLETLPLTAPLVALGVGDDTLPAPDLAIAAIEAPPAVERDASFVIKATVKAHGPHELLQQHTTTRLTLHQEDDNGHSAQIAATNAILQNGVAEIHFTASCATTGRRLYTIKAAPWGNEKFLFNNQRTAGINIRNSAVKVLFHARQIGADLKFLRQALASDAAINFTALYRSGFDSFTVHGDATANETLTGGFPAQAADLRPFGAIIIGSFPVEEWSAAQMGALLAYVEEGGGVIWLGGSDSFDAGGYLDSPLRPLIPWQNRSDNNTLLRGSFSVSLAPQPNTITTGLADLLGGAASSEAAAMHVTSLNCGGSLIPGAQPLLLAATGADTVPLAIEHRYGRGRVITIASNTTWLWARTAGAPARFYNLFWRQAVRAVAGSAASGAHLRLTWDRESYRPGEIANLQLQGEGGNNLTLRATAMHNGERTAISAERQADSDTWRCSWRLTDNKPVTVEASLDSAGTHLETCAIPIPLAVPPAESSHLLPNHQTLKTFAETSGGAFAANPETAAALLWEAAAPRAATHTFSPFATPWPLLTLTILLALELLLRRRHNLL